MKIHLPLWPPTTNTIYRNVHGKTMLGARARKFYRDGLTMLVYRIPSQQRAALPLPGPFHVVVRLYPPDRRKFDVDNRLKALLDLLTKAGIWGDDSEVDKITVSRETIRKGGEVEVEIWEQPEKT